MGYGKYCSLTETVHRYRRQLSHVNTYGQFERRKVCPINSHWKLKDNGRPKNYGSLCTFCEKLLILHYSCSWNNCWLCHWSIGAIWCVNTLKYSVAIEIGLNASSSCSCYRWRQRQATWMIFTKLTIMLQLVMLFVRRKRFTCCPLVYHTYSGLTWRLQISHDNEMYRLYVETLSQLCTMVC